MTQEDKDALEALIDQHSMASNYDDRYMASAWRRGSTRLSSAQAFEDWPL